MRRDRFVGQADGSFIQTNDGIIAPGGLPGLSKHTLSAQAYYQIGDFDMQVNYKYRFLMERACVLWVTLVFGKRVLHMT